MEWIAALALIAGGAYVLTRKGTAEKPQAKKSQSKTPQQPYRAVSIRPGNTACSAALAQKDRRFLLSESPKLPLADCDQSSCDCSYKHHPDRRDAEAGDRRLDNALSSQLYEVDHQERRGRKRGRRKDDM